MTGRQVHDQAGHCPLTGRYFKPCTLISESLWMQRFQFTHLFFLLCNFRKIDEGDVMQSKQIGLVSYY